MTKKDKAQGRLKKIKEIERRALQERKSWNVKKCVLTALQAFCGAAIGVCFFSYYSNAKLIVDSRAESYEYTPSLVEIGGEYLESSVYSANIDNAVSTVLRYVAIREQMEDKGVYNSNKAVNIGEFANRFIQDSYEGPVVEYYLDDLIKWGQKAASNSELYYKYEFYTAADYCEFFGLDYGVYMEENGYPAEDAIVTSFETLKNQYLTIDGHRLEEYVDNEEDYRELVSCLTKSCDDIYSNYLEYLAYNEYFNEDNTNIRFAVYTSTKGIKTLYTNDSKLNKGASEQKIESVLKSYGEYLYACPATLNYVTNTPVLYDTVKAIVIDEYPYAFADDTKIWISLDTTYPVPDVFFVDSIAFQKTAKIIPWLISLGAAFFIGFIAIAIYIVNKERKIYSVEGAKDGLRDFEKVPVEIGVLFFILLVMILYLGESILLKRMTFSQTDSIMTHVVPACIFVFIDIFIALAFIYGITRRIICKNLFEGSIYSVLSPKMSRYTNKIKRWFYRVYDSGGVSVKIWGGYIAFLLFNVFWACMLFFSNHPIIAFVILFIFDGTVGLVLFNRNWERKKILDGIRNISEGDYKFKIDNIKMHGANKELADAVNNIGLGLGRAVEISTKDEKLKADLITNVSHDIKTPLTSIINYVDLLKRADIKDEKALKYIEVLDEKSQRLRQLTFDLVEASKITSGNISIDLVKVNFIEFIKQAVGEFEEKYGERGLSLVLNIPSNPVYVMVDPRHMWRVLENLLNNIYKYALQDTRVYLDIVVIDESDIQKMVVSFKNISGQQLNIPADELTERFIRGDVSRSTEGSGLGLSIAKSLTTAQQGEFDIYLDGDLFKVTLTFDIAE